jgi:hypothetical protein
MDRRRLPLVVGLATVILLASLCWLSPLSRTSQAAPAPSGESSFKGKVLHVSTTQMSLFLLENAQVQKIGEHSWLVGKGAADGRMGSWYKGRTVRLQMEHIVSITEFDDLKEAKKALESGGATPIGGGGYGISLEVDRPVPPGVAPAPAVPAPVAPAPAVPPPAAPQDVPKK